MAFNPRELAIVIFPDPVLRQPAAPIEEVTDEVRAVAARMLELMHEEEGLGLAAPQVGHSWRMFVAAANEEQPARVFINPVLSQPSAETLTREEGCLSIPDVRVEVTRPAAISIAATDLEGRSFTLRGGDLVGRVWQHEVDHLNGVLIIDKMRPMDRLANRKALKALKSR